jgi:hypothetical protein
MHSSAIWHLWARGCYFFCRPRLAPRRLRSPPLVGCALAFLLAIAAGQPARSQNSLPEAPPPAADEPGRSAAQPAAASPPAPVDEVKAYLWSVYQRSPTKVDGHGDFTWKDVSAAGRSGHSVEDYVIGGLDPDFRELLFAAGHAMDTAGVGWTILSGFRDDFRQNLASGLKARVNNSFHGGSEATGGYRHGCAVDLASVDRSTGFPTTRCGTGWTERAVNSISSAPCAQPIPRIPCQWRDGMSWRRRCGTSGSGFLPKLIRGPSVTSLLSSNTCACAPFHPTLLLREPGWRKLRVMEPQAGSPVKPPGMTQIPTGMVLLKSQRVFASSQRSLFGPPPRLLTATSLITTRPPRSIEPAHAVAGQPSTRPRIPPGRRHRGRPRPSASSTCWTCSQSSRRTSAVSASSSRSISS